MAEEPETSTSTTTTFYKLLRTIKKRENNLYNILQSIYEDSLFVQEISLIWPSLPLVANLRCGRWYSKNFHSSCYFKSTDGHFGKWNFSLTRLNMHIALLAAETGGCIVVDATKKGKRFPDSLSKTIPIWACVLNRALFQLEFSEGSTENDLKVWDSYLHLPSWITPTEVSSIDSKIEGWVKHLLNSGADLHRLKATLKKPLRTLWISQNSLIWLNHIPTVESWPFTPLILVSASRPAPADLEFSGIPYFNEGTEEYSWQYIPGAADDEESWSQGLSPELFWKYQWRILEDGPQDCHKRVAEIIRESVKSSKNVASSSMEKSEVVPCGADVVGFHWLGDTKLGVGSLAGLNLEKNKPNCLVICGGLDLLKDVAIDPSNVLFVDIQDSKFERLSILRHLSEVVNFSSSQLRNGQSVGFCCSSGETFIRVGNFITKSLILCSFNSILGLDLSICMCLGVMISLFDQKGSFKGEAEGEKVTKAEVKKFLALLSSFHPMARPSRGNLKQVFNFFVAKDPQRSED